MTDLNVAYLRRRPALEVSARNDAPSVPTSPPLVAPRDDPRYRSRRWKRVRVRILARDLHRCRIVIGCPNTANVVDHVVPVYVGMPDDLFFGDGNLRAGCAVHNKARAAAAQLEPAAGATGGIVAKDYT